MSTPETKSASSDVSEPTVDVEHMPVADDPRKWSNARKNFVLLQVAFGSVIAGLGGNIQTAAIAEMEADLPATPSQISLSLSLFMLLQGLFPLMWVSISEVKGRKLIYIISMLLFTAGSVVVAVSNSVGLVIGFRCLQAAGSSAVLSIGAATLADIYDPAERGRKMGFYYVAPLLATSLAPIIGGGLTSAFTWRGAFWFCTIDGGAAFLSFLLLFKDTYRCERSLTYQNVLKARLREAARKKALRAEQAELDSPGGNLPHENTAKDLEKQDITVTEASEIIPQVKLGLRDINPFTPLLLTIRRTYNVFMILASGLNFAFEFVVVYTTSRSLNTYYHFSPVKIGLSLLAFGLGTVSGSAFGGRWSDYQLARLKAKNGGQGTPEMRLRSTVHGLVLFPLCVAGFAWVLQERLHIAGVCVMLFACGFVACVVYASSLAYIIDSNVGRSGSAIALNSFVRCTLAFAFEEIAVPMQDALGDVLLIVAVMYKGAQWRTEADARELAAQEKQ
ncbi:MFS general substrate transporter [Gymnopus androsaceus JB14]|uniref:MFS general substrate transporter n=1 Tax=Gymnopus androsaceus JB14 TaxID=1447944 RepID=A0A6A4HJM8_9AGAR|nr:MFS general substrate transporter [Gymnopus androsaceus JB14]